MSEFIPAKMYHDERAKREQLEQELAQHKKALEAAASQIEHYESLSPDAVCRAAARWRVARQILSHEDIERADSEMAGLMSLEEENAKTDAAIDAIASRYAPEGKG